MGKGFTTLPGIDIAARAQEALDTRPELQRIFARWLFEAWQRYLDGEPERKDMAPRP